MRLARLLAAPVRGGGAVLCFHGITTPDLPGNASIHVSVEQFLTLTGALRDVAEIVPLREIIDRNLAGRSTGGLAAITFDDAYVGLQREAERLFRRPQIPATVFAISDAMRSGARFWWDRLDDVLPRIDDARWRAFENALGLPQEYRDGQPAYYGRMWPLRQWILAEYKGRWPERFAEPLAALEHDAGYATPQRSMTFAELEALSADGLVDVGVHTVTHPVLPLLAEDQVTYEIAESYRVLRERLPRTLPAVALPYGFFDERTMQLAQRAGMRASFTLGDWTDRGLPRGWIPRINVSRQEEAWKLRLRALGLVERSREWKGADRRAAPALPGPRS